MRHVLVIGSGVVGLCAAYYAVRRGFRVTVLDRRPLSQGCSHGNAGMIVPSHIIPLAAPGAVALGLKWMWNPESPFWIKPRFDWELAAWSWRFWRAATEGHVQRAAPVLRDLHLASRRCFEELAIETGDGFGLVQRGLLMLCKTERGLEDEGHLAERARVLGVPAEVLDARQTAVLDPAIEMDVVGAVFFPKDCHLSPQAFMARLQELCRAAGVCFCPGREVTSIRSEGRRIRSVLTQDGELEADDFVLCGGAWSSSLAAGLGLRLPMQAGKGYTLTLEAPPQMPGICALLSEARIAVTPMGKSLRIGGTMEIAGLNEVINPVRVQGIAKTLPHYYPAFSLADFAGIEPWCGLRPCSPDGLPYLGRTRAHDNLIVATGHAMMGLSLGPVTGQLVAGLLSGEEWPVELRLLDPDRYA
jgi:D-amino-acid dehydrogenase